MASKIAQDSPTWLQLARNMPPRASGTAPRRPQVGKEPSKEALETPKSFKNIGKPMFFAFSPFRSRWALEASRWLQDGPRGPQEGARRAPRRPQERPGPPQELPKRAPGGSFSGPDGGRQLRHPPFFDRWPQEGLQRIKYGLKRAPRAPTDGPKRAP